MVSQSGGKERGCKLCDVCVEGGREGGREGSREQTDSIPSVFR